MSAHARSLVEQIRRIKEAVLRRRDAEQAEYLTAVVDALAACASSLHEREHEALLGEVLDIPVWTAPQVWRPRLPLAPLAPRHPVCVHLASSLDDARHGVLHKVYLLVHGAVFCPLVQLWFCMRSWVLHVPPHVAGWACTVRSLSLRHRMWLLALHRSCVARCCAW